MTISLIFGTLYGTTQRGGSYGDGTVFELTTPEPGSLMLLAVGGIGLLIRKRIF
jgi:PEP-CTERM motif